jgi:hypothetical protein
MIYLNANTTHAHCWVGHEEVARGDIFGDWKRFTYYVNGHRQYIYCRNQKVFLTLFAHWCSWASIANARKKPSDLPISDEQWEKIKYYYAIDDVEGVAISTEDIIMDNPDSKPIRVKSLIHTQCGEYIQ